MDVQWETCEDILPINSYITSHTVPMEMANPLDWSFDVHLIEIDDVDIDVIYSNIELNRIVLKAKEDTGAQINVCCLKQYSRLYRRRTRTKINCHCTPKLVSSWLDMGIRP